MTASIQKLESDLGVILLERGRRGAKLTSAGAALLPHARAALAAVDDGRRAVQEVAQLTRGEVRLGAGATACTYLLPPTLARYRAQHPQIRFFLREVNNQEAVAALERNEIDLAIVTHPDAEPWFEDELVLICAPDAEVPDVDRAPFVTFRPGATARSLLERVFPDAWIVMELGGIAAVKGNVRAGVGVALVSLAAVEMDLKRNALAQISDPRTPVVRRLGLLHRGVERLPPAAAALRQMLLERVSVSA